MSGLILVLGLMWYLSKRRGRKMLTLDIESVDIGLSWLILISYIYSVYADSTGKNPVMTYGIIILLIGCVVIDRYEVIEGYELRKSLIGNKVSKYANILKTV